MAQINFDKLTPREAEAVRLREEFRATVVALSRNVADIGTRRVKLAEAWRSTRIRIQNLQAEQAAANEKAEKDLLDSFFAAPTDPAGVIARRDADDRAAQATTSEQSLSLLARAALSKDLVLAKAVLLVAMLRGEPQRRTVIAGFKTRWPDLANDVDLLAVSPSFRDGGVTDGRQNSQDLANLIASASAFSIPPRPNELNGLSDEDIERLVQESYYGASNPA